MQQNLNEEPKKILSPQINSSVPGLGGAAEFWHWDSITYVGNFIIRWFTLSSVSNSTLVNITIILIIDVNTDWDLIRYVGNFIIRWFT